ncbi:MAG TPA: hypothetical protein VEI06_11735 [Gemmatimonadaceae bacterium]|nr:hypothetical protein [Gemmatimonadaceae bacterium]
MTSPTEEVGLNGLRLASAVRDCFARIPSDQVAAMLREIHRASVQQRLIYLRDGEPETIRVLPCPITALPEQLSYVHYVTLTIHNALKRLLDIYLVDERVRELLRVTPWEEEWIRGCWTPGHAESNPVFGRLDAVVDFISPMWKASLLYLEPNLTGIGGLHIAPTCERIVADIVVPTLQSYDPALHLEIGADIRELLMQEVLEHLQRIGRPARRVCFVEPKYAGSGPEEQQALAEYYHERYGMRVMHADPSELEVRGSEVTYEGECVDLAYRDYAVLDLVELQHEGVDVEPMRRLFRENRVISSLAAELDQKSCWEVLTDPELEGRYFSNEERRIFRRHILWTRLLWDRKTALPDGSTEGLLEFVRRERESLVIKPNRGYGGEGVIIGHGSTQSEWESAIERALWDSERWVVQRLASIPVRDLPVASEDGAVHMEPFYSVMGFAPSSDGVAILARVSQQAVVNVAQRGGICAVMLGHAPAPRAFAS